MHFLVGSFGFLEGPDEACNFVKVFSVGTGGIKCASRAIIRFHNSLWLSEFRTLDP